MKASWILLLCLMVLAGCQRSGQGIFAKRKASRSPSSVFHAPQLSGKAAHDLGSRAEGALSPVDDLDADPPGHPTEITCLSNENVVIYLPKEENARSPHLQTSYRKNDFPYPADFGWQDVKMTTLVSGVVAVNALLLSGIAALLLSQRNSRNRKRLFWAGGSVLAVAGFELWIFIQALS